MELVETFDDKTGAKRIYRVDPKTGREYFWYADKREKVVLREALSTDAENISSTFKGILKCTAIKSKKPIDQIVQEEIDMIREEIEKHDSEDPNLILVIEKKSNKPNRFIAFGEIACKNNTPDAQIILHFVSKEVKRQYKNRICQAFTNVCDKYKLYDELELVDSATGRKVERVLYSVMGQV